MELAVCNRKRTDRHQAARVVPELVRLHGLEAHADEEVRALEALEHDGIGRYAAAAAEEQRVVFGQHCGLRRHEDRYPQPVHERPNRARICVRVPVEPEDDNRPARAAQVRRDPVNPALRQFDARGEAPWRKAAVSWSSGLIPPPS